MTEGGGAYPRENAKILVGEVSHSLWIELHGDGVSRILSYKVE